MSTQKSMTPWWLAWLLFALALPLASWWWGREPVLILFGLILSTIGLRWASTALGRLSPAGRSPSAPSSTKKDDFLGGCLFFAMGLVPSSCSSAP